MRRMLVVVLVGALALVVGACSGSSSDGGSEDDGISTTSAYFGDGEDTADTTAADDPTSTTEAADASAGGDLVGTWTADAADLLGANTANLGGPGAVTCSGPVTLELADDGTFTHGGDVTCSVPGGPSASGTITSTGRWSVDGTTVTLSGTETTSDVDGISQLIGDGSATFAVEGDQLTVTFTVDPVGEVSQVYTRA